MGFDPIGYTREDKEDDNKRDQNGTETLSQQLDKVLCDSERLRIFSSEVTTNMEILTRQQQSNIQGTSIHKAARREMLHRTLARITRNMEMQANHIRQTSELLSIHENIRRGVHYQHG